MIRSKRPGAKRTRFRRKHPKRIGSCRIIADPSGQIALFQIKVTDMPIKIKLCEDKQGAPAKTSSFNTIQVFEALSNPPKLVAGQPTGITATDFSLTLPLGEYDIVMVLNHLPGSQIAYVYESCGGLNQLARIPVLIHPSGYFSLRVV